MSLGPFDTLGEDLGTGIGIDPLSLILFPFLSTSGVMRLAHRMGIALGAI